MLSNQTTVIWDRLTGLLRGDLRLLAKLIWARGWLHRETVAQHGSAIGILRSQEPQSWDSPLRVSIDRYLQRPMQLRQAKLGKGE